MNLGRSKFSYLLFLFYLFASAFPAKADNDYEFKRYSEKDGLPHQFIYDITQDAQGYLWIATGNGLARFDGSQMIKFSHADSLKSSFFTSLLRMENNKILAGEVRGVLTIFNEKKVVPEGKIKKFGSRVNRIKSHGDEIWILSSNEGFIKLKKNQITHVTTSLFDQLITNDFQIDGRNIIVGTNEGLLHLKSFNDSLTLIKEYKNLKYQPITRIVKSKTKFKILAGTEEGGLWGIEQIDGESNPVQLISPEIIENQPIEVILEQNHRLWIGTPQRGVFLFTLIDGKYILTGKFNVENGFLSNLISSGFIDKEGSLWFGTNGDGLIQVKQKQFSLILPAANQELSFLSLCTTSSYGLLAGTSNGIFQLKYDPIKNDYNFEKKYFEEVDNMKISSLFEDTYGNLWIGTEDSGIFYFDHNLKQIQKFVLDPLIKNYKIRLITQDVSGNLWFSIAGYGVYRYNSEDKTVKNYSIRTKFIHNEVYDIFPDSFNRKWFSTYATGLAKMDGKTFQFPSREGALPSNDINAVTEDQQGNIWIATEGNGVFMFDGKKYENFTEENGLFSNFCKKVIVDEANNKWILHRNGTSCINAGNEYFYANSLSKEVNKYELIESFTATDSLGNIYTGSSNFLIKIINPGDIFRSSSKVFVDRIRFFFKEKDLAQYYRTVGGISQLFFPYNENHLTFDFQTVTFKFEPQQIQYQFKLDGFDDGWSPLSGKPSATYTNLEPGKYTFRVKFVNPINKQDWAMETLKFTITPPFWKRWWFIAFGVIFFTGIVSGSYIFRIRQVKRRNKELEELVNERTREIAAQKELISGKNLLLEKAKEDIMKINIKLVEANSNLEDKIYARTQELNLILKKLLESNAELDTFIYHASHDLRGPLARLKGLTMLSEQEENNQIYLHLIDDEIIKMDKILGKLTDAHYIFIQEVNYTEIDVDLLLQEIFLDVSQFNEFKRINIIKQYTEGMKIVGDTDLIKIILENLIENSVVFLNDIPGNSPYINIDLSREDQQLNIKIQDNGSGIPEMVQDKIFDMYFKGSHRSKGNGLGLYLVKKASEKLQGEVKFISTESSTTFTVSLPISAPSVAKNLK